MEHNKLVRDKIPAIIETKGEIAITHQAEDEEYQTALDLKLLEETQEFVTSHRQEELVDILEVIHSVARETGISMEELEKMRVQKKKGRGGFEGRIILERTEKRNHNAPLFPSYLKRG